MNDETLNGLTDGTFRARWLREVFRTPHITESVKLLLISMAVEEMDATGRVSVPREDLAVRIGRGKARVSERVQEAVNQGLLIRVSAGKKGSTAVYAAAVNGSACSDLIGTSEDPEKGPATRTESEHFGSGLQDAEPESKGPAIRTEIMFGSGLQDAKNDDEVRTGGPNDQKKGPPTRAAKVEEGVGGVELPNDSADEDFLKMEDAAAPRAPKSSKRAKRPATPKIPLSPDFAPDAGMLAWARDKCPLVDIGTQTELFIRHFTDPEKPQVKRPGWVRSWETWMLRQQGWAKDRPSNVHQLRPTGTGGHQPYRNPQDPSVYFEDM
ncbi:hypothetical protein AB0F88_39865 [Streptosporangium sp. NPDC023963]|uniref:hypothetical protein n=1 Tax=Streptosporangium sp. NPDC023963 TaxID=3155608 RepID=UPI003435DD7C